MVQTAHLRNPFKSIKTLKQSYDNIYDKIDPVILEEKILKLKLAQWFTRRFFFFYFLNVFLQFFYFVFSLWKKVWPFNLNKLKSSSTKHACFLSSLVEIGPPVQEKNIFFYLSMYFRYFISSPIGQGQDPFICTNLNSLTQECFVPSLVEIGPVVLKKKMKM